MRGTSATQEQIPAGNNRLELSMLVGLTPFMEQQALWETISNPLQSFDGSGSLVGTYQPMGPQPGKTHIQFHDNEADGVANIDNADDVVVSPENLPHDRQSDVCGQCHSVHRPDFEAYPNEKLMQVGMPFRPGDDLEASPLKILLRSTPESAGTRAFARAKEEPNMHYSFWPDGTVRVAGREYNGLIESACFQQGKMSCFSCHEMHPGKTVDLEIGMLDDYDAIRVITMRTLPGYENLDIDEFADIRQRAEAVSRFLKEFNRDASLEPRPELLIDEDGRIDIKKASLMFNARDQTPIFIQE